MTPLISVRTSYRQAETVGRLGFITVIFTASALCSIGQSSVVISQIYGGGGNVGATLRNDYVELFNRGGTAVAMNGWTIQHTSGNGSNWDRATVSGMIQPGQYYLLQLAQGTLAPRHFRRRMRLPV